MCMTQPAPTPSHVPEEIPESFFTSLPGAPTLPRARPDADVRRPSTEIKAMVLYDAIIDWMLINPGGNISTCAAELGKKTSTISLVVRSDFFKARWLQRRAKYNEDLNFRLQSKLAHVAELALDKTAEALKTRANVPLPDLTDLSSALFDRLGYAPGRGGGAAVQVNVQQNAAPAAPAVSAEGLAKARENLRILEQMNAASGHRPGNTHRMAQSDAASGGGPVVEGEVVRVEGAGDSSSA